MPTEETDLEISNDGLETGSEPVGQPLEDLVNKSGILTNENIPGVNHMKQQKINTYVDGLIQEQGLIASNVQILSKDNGEDIRVTIYNDGAIHSQINYSQIP